MKMPIKGLCLEAIIFDFDGVLCESLEVKKEAFRKLFLDYPDQVDRIVDFHMQNGGMSRFDKFEIIFRDFLDEKLTQERSMKLGNQFRDYCYEGVIQSPYVKGAKDFLEKYFEEFMLFIVSGTPQEEMMEIVDAKGLSKYFKGIYGSPANKGDLVIKILNENNISHNKAIFVGDALADYEGAKESGVPFIARMHEEYPDPFSQLQIEARIKDLLELDQLIGKKFRG